MGGLFGVVSKEDCVMDLFFGTDYHSHLGTRRGGMATYTGEGFSRAIHNIENAPFRTKFERDVTEMAGCSGVGCISDSDPQPLIIRSGLGSYVIATVGFISNAEALTEQILKSRGTHFQEMSSDRLNQTELVACLINCCDTVTEGIGYAQSLIEGSMTMLVLTHEGLYAARDRLGRTPLVLGGKKDAYCVSFESFAYLNLGYTDYRELGPGEIVLMTPDGVEVVSPPGEKMKICAFLWTYYGYPTSSYEGVNVEEMRYRCGARLAEGDDSDAEFVAGVPDSGTAHAIGYANASRIPFARPLIKYTPTWPRSFTPSDQRTRNLVARMKMIPVDALIRDRNLLFIDDSIVRGTQLSETVDFLYTAGARHVHIRPACPPILFGCKYLQFTRSSAKLELITRRTIYDIEGKADDLTSAAYIDDNSDAHKEMVDRICKGQNFTSLKFQKLTDMLDAIGLPHDRVCTYCWNGK